MKTIHRIALGVALLAAAVIFIWKDSIPFLSSSVLAPSGQKEFRMQLPTGYTKEMYMPYIDEIILKKYPECLSTNSVSLSVSSDIMTVRFECGVKDPPTIYPLTTQ